MNGRAMHYLATHPGALAKFQQTGKLPQEHIPNSPLYTLLHALGTFHASSILGVTVDFRLGYEGRRMFANAQQAMHWLSPGGFQSPPSESWQNKRFQKRLYLEDLLACSTSYPNRLLQDPDCRHLRRK